MDIIALLIGVLVGVVAAGVVASVTIWYEVRDYQTVPRNQRVRFADFVAWWWAGVGNQRPLRNQDLKQSVDERPDSGGAAESDDQPHE